MLGVCLQVGEMGEHPRSLSRELTLVSHVLTMSPRRTCTTTSRLNGPPVALAKARAAAATVGVGESETNWHADACALR